ncbi:protein of unknown function [Alteromonas macleodii]|uniref:Uncharacterized protein n=1 Tax=Alteromonas macleodii TaxID=28108 RepID=A0A6T9Y3X6_ALTMA|nr:protein of unknown function [Alteromonas macleodii]
MLYKQHVVNLASIIGRNFFVFREIGTHFAKYRIVSKTSC